MIANNPAHRVSPSLLDFSRWNWKAGRCRWRWGTPRSGCLKAEFTWWRRGSTSSCGWEPAFSRSCCSTSSARRASARSTRTWWGEMDRLRCCGFIKHFLNGDLIQKRDNKIKTRGDWNTFYPEGGVYQREGKTLQFLEKKLKHWLLNVFLCLQQCIFYPVFILFLLFYLFFYTTTNRTLCTVFCPVNYLVKCFFCLLVSGHWLKFSYCANSCIFTLP